MQVRALPTPPMVMLVDQREGVEWVVDRCAEVLSAWGGRLVVERTGTRQQERRTAARRLGQQV